jgi:hypothetical protein
MTTINILILSLSILTEEQAQRKARRAAEQRDDELNKTGAAQMETANKAARELLQEDELFTKGYWICDKNHRFAPGEYRSPHHCSVCGSPLFRWIPGR